MNSKKVYVTGYGTFSAIGLSLDETLESLQAGRSGLGRITVFETKHGDLPVGEVKISNAEMRRMLDIEEGVPASRTVMMALLASEQAFAMSHSTIAEPRMGIVAATTVGGRDYNESDYLRIAEGRGDRRALDMVDCAYLAHELAKRWKLSHNITTVSTACSSAANAIIVAARMIRNGLADKVLAGGADGLSLFTVNGFNSLEIVSPTGCRPFDARRNGLSLGEGAAWLLLEGERSLAADRICELSGYANTNEAYHQTASSPDGQGAALTINEALASAGLQAADISYINAHGTGTETNDLSEGLALATVFGNAVPPFSSTKGFTGHTLAAAGAVEAVISILALRNGLVFPNIGFSEAMPELSITPASTLQSANIRHVLSNSFGFGGSDASLIFSKI